MPELNPAAISASPGTPYVTPQVLLAAPTGVVWSTIGPGPRPSEIQQFNEQLNLCRRATSMIDGYCNQPLRATEDNETLFGPGDLRFQMSPNGNARLLLSRSPVAYVVSGQVAMAASFPPQWTQVGASQFKAAVPLVGVYGSTVPGGSDNSGQAVYMAPGLVSWRAGRYGYEVQVNYVNGWPHGSIQAPAAEGDMTIQVDDCTGWCNPFGIGATATIYDSSMLETFTVASASAMKGPGTLALRSPLAYPHAVGVMVSTMPQSIIQSAILYCVAQALTRGATATSIQATAGSMAGGGSGTDLAGEAELLIHPYRRVI